MQKNKVNVHCSLLKLCTQSSEKIVKEHCHSSTLFFINKIFVKIKIKIKAEYFKAG